MTLAHKHFARFHERSPSPRLGLCLRGGANRHTLYAWLFFRARGLAPRGARVRPVILAPITRRSLDPSSSAPRSAARSASLPSRALRAPLQWLYTPPRVPLRRGFADEEALRRPTGARLGGCVAGKRGGRSRPAAVVHGRRGIGVLASSPARPLTVRYPRLLDLSTVSAAVPQGHDPFGDHSVGADAERPATRSRHLRTPLPEVRKL